MPFYAQAKLGVSGPRPGAEADRTLYPNLNRARNVSLVIHVDITYGVERRNSAYKKKKKITLETERVGKEGETVPAPSGVMVIAVTAN